MRKLIILPSIMALLFASLTLITPAFAKDVVLKAPIQSLTTGVGKDGNPYIRIIITEMRVIEGIEYPAGTVVMAFRGHVDAVSKLKDGDTLHAIATERFWNDHKSYTILKLLE